MEINEIIDINKCINCSWCYLKPDCKNKRKKIINLKEEGKQTMNNIFDILTSYYENDKEVQKLANDMQLSVVEIAEMKAFKMQDTDEGKVLYQNIMSVLAGGMSEQTI